MTTMMAREIAAQATLLEEIRPRLAERADALARPSGRVLAGGCGDSAFAPRALSEVCRRLGRPVMALSAMELASFTDFEPGDTVILSSISGGTRRTVEAAQVASAAGARVVAVTCHADSALALASGETVELPFAPLSRRTPHTLDYAVTLLALVEIARSAAGRAPEITAPVVAAVPALLARTGAVARRLADAHVADRNARETAAARIVLLGAGPDLGTAEYGAAKFHEAGGLPALAAETENFVHGMNFLLEPGDTVIALGGTRAGATRGEAVIEALRPLVTQAYLHVPDRTPGVEEESWSAAFLCVLDETFLLQQLCLRIAETLGLELEAPRAGRDKGAQHLAAQSRILMR